MFHQNKDPLEEALEGRLPVLPAERIYQKYGALLWTTAVLSAASYAYLVGGALASFGNTRLSIAGYLVGLIAGEVVVALAVGIPSYRSGVDTVDAAKSSLGTRGAALVLLSVLATCLGWAYVLVAMTAEGAGSLVQMARGAAGAREEWIVGGVSWLLLAIVWALAKRGPAAMARLSAICAPGQIAIAVGLLGLLLYKYGASALWVKSGASDPEAGRLLPIAFGVELGFANALSVLPYLGGLTRLVRHRRHLVGPTVVGSGIVGAWLIAMVAALATATSGESEPATWILHLAGPMSGTVIVAFLLIANIGTLVVQVYVAGVAAQQIRWMAGLPWKWVLAIAVAPGAILAFKTRWLLGQVATLLGYNGVMFVGMAGIMFADYFLIQRQRVQVPHLFASSAQGAYWYAGGVNWIAMSVIAGAGALYLAMFNPISMAVHPAFRFAGAGIPSVLLAALVYWGAMSAKRRSMISRAGPVKTQMPRTLEVGI